MIKIIKGVIDRRLLINYRLDPTYVAKILPEPFRPRLLNGHALGGMCLIRFKDMRPTWLPKFFGTTSENGTHRFCVEWTVNEQVHTGIYVKQRFTNSRFHEFGGGKLFPGNLIYSDFSVEENDGKYKVAFKSRNGDSVDVLVDEMNADFPSGSLFTSIESASEYYEKANVGYTSTGDNKVYQGVELRAVDWKVSPLNVLNASSSLFTNENIFPAGTAQIDHALLMKDIKHDWQVVDDVCCS